MPKNYILAVTTLMGTIIGVGLFALPYITVKSGILPLFFYMLVLGVIQYYLHLVYAEIVLSTKTAHRLPGYVGKYCGTAGKKATLIITILSDYGSILAYIIVGGLFFYQLLNPFFGGSLLFYSSLLFLLEIIIVLFGIKSIAGSEFIMTVFLILIIGLISWRGRNFIDPANYRLIEWKNILLPYGPVFFAVSGAAAIPEVCKLLENGRQKIKSAIFWGTFLSAVAMTLFITVIVGITGPRTTPDTLSGLGGIFGDGIIRLALVFGLLAVVTSMITITQASREVFWWDFKIDKYLSWLLAGFIPLGIFLGGLRNITKVVGLTGALAGGLIGLVMVWLLLRVKLKSEKKSEIKNKINLPIAYLLSLAFILGLAYEFWRVLQ